jgi:hypothetical protein
MKTLSEPRAFALHLQKKENYGTVKATQFLFSCLRLDFFFFRRSGSGIKKWGEKCRMAHIGLRTAQ